MLPYRTGAKIHLVGTTSTSVRFLIAKRLLTTLAIT